MRAAALAKTELCPTRRMLHFGLLFTPTSPCRAPLHPGPPQIPLTSRSWVTLTCLTILSRPNVTAVHVTWGKCYVLAVRKKTLAVAGWVIFHCFHSNSVISPAAKILNLRWKCLPGISPLIPLVPRSSLWINGPSSCLELLLFQHQQPLSAAGRGVSVHPPGTQQFMPGLKNKAKPKPNIMALDVDRDRSWKCPLKGEVVLEGKKMWF